MEDVKKITDKIEYLFLRTVIDALKSGAMTVEQARAHATDFLSIEPIQSIADAKDKIARFTEKYPNYKNLMDFVNAYDYEEKVSAVIEKMRTYINEKDIDSALQVAVKN